MGDDEGAEVRPPHALYARSHDLDGVDIQVPNPSRRRWPDGALRRRGESPPLFLPPGKSGVSGTVQGERG
jgi:hypothetical protein